MDAIMDVALLAGAAAAAAAALAAAAKPEPKRIPARDRRNRRRD